MMVMTLSAQRYLTHKHTNIHKHTQHTETHTIQWCGGRGGVVWWEGLKLQTGLFFCLVSVRLTPACPAAGSRCSERQVAWSPDRLLPSASTNHSTVALRRPITAQWHKTQSRFPINVHFNLFQRVRDRE